MTFKALGAALISLSFSLNSTAAPELPELREILSIVTDRAKPPAISVTRAEHAAISEAAIHSMANKPDLALKALERVRSKRGSAKIDFALAQVHQSMGNTELAIETFKRAIVKAPKFGAAHQSLGTLYLVVKPPQHNQAIDSLLTAARLGHATTANLTYIGQSYLTLKMYPEAVYALEGVLEREPNNALAQALLSEARRQ